MTAGDRTKVDISSELGLINIGGDGTVTVNRSRIPSDTKWNVYGMGAKEVAFASDDEQPAKFYLNTLHRRAEYPTVVVKPEGTPEEEGVVIVKDAIK